MKTSHVTSCVQVGLGNGFNTAWNASLGVGSSSPSPRKGKNSTCCGVWSNLTAQLIFVWKKQRNQNRSETDIQKSFATRWMKYFVDPPKLILFGFSWLLGYKWLPTCNDHTFTNSHAFFDPCTIPALSSQIYSIFVY